MADSAIKSQFPDEMLEGEFIRQEDAFHDCVRADGSSPYPVEAGRYHLYVSLACPWAHRTIITRLLCGLEGAIGMTVVDPVRDERGWRFGDGPGFSRDPLNGFTFLREAYLATDPRYSHRVTVPVLWDGRTKRIVNNFEDDIIRMFAIEFAALSTRRADLFPARWAAQIDELNVLLYETVNNGVYRAGFATSQAAYERAVRRLFATLDMLEERLATRRYLFGAQPVESDWRLFVTLLRFDPVYYVHFKCNLRLIAQYPNLFGYVRDLYQLPGISATVDFDHIKRHYYLTHGDINPTLLVPLGPVQDLSAPHGRERLG